jgi:hypothetical protein
MTKPTVALYVRIPLELRSRLEEFANRNRGYRRRGQLQVAVINAIAAGLDKLDAAAPHGGKRKAVTR